MLPMRKFKYLPHTADAAFIGFGKDFGEAIENAALAMLNIRFDLKSIEADKGQTKSITIMEQADTRENLAWYALQDILSKVDSKSLSAFKFTVIRLSVSKDGRLTLAGKLFYKLTRKDHTLTDVKAVTPHEFKVEHKKDWRIRVVVDI